MNRVKLIEAGVDYDGGVKRFAGHAALYEKYLRKLFEDGSMAELERQIEEGNAGAAFRSAHNLKGLAGNLSVTAFYGIMRELANLLRGGSPAGARELYGQAKTTYEIVEKAAGE